MTQQQGFSLVELSIVLVILGLLTGGILGGQALIRAAELRSITTDVDKYRTAAYAFQGKYRALPGDMKNAVRFWGAQAGGVADGIDATCAALDYTTPATGTETCNGDGNGRIVGSGWHEVWRAWQHLANAGMVAGNFAGVPATASVSVGLAGFNMPASKISSAGFAFVYSADVSVVGGAFFPGKYGNVLRFGGNTEVDDAPWLTPEETWSIDTKIDDGSPATGVLRVYTPNRRANCTTSDDPDDAEYNLSYGSDACNLLFVIGL